MDSEKKQVLASVLNIVTTLQMLLNCMCIKRTRKFLGNFFKFSFNGEMRRQKAECEEGSMLAYILYKIFTQM